VKFHFTIPTPDGNPMPPGLLSAHNPHLNLINNGHATDVPHVTPDGRHIRYTIDPAIPDDEARAFARTFQPAVTVTLAVDQPLIDELCREAARLLRCLDATGNDPEHHSTDRSVRTGALTARVQLHGKVQGLYTALCYIHGWDPREEADTEGKAGELVLDWQDRNPEAADQ
jgi:hypothetical protein